MDSVTAKDAVIDYFSGWAVELAEELDETRAARDAYEALAKEALNALHTQTQQNKRLTAQLERLREEYRHLRERQLSEAA